MGLDLGELSGRMGLDIIGLRRDTTTAKAELRGIADEADRAGAEAGIRFGDSFGDKSKAAVAAAGAGLLGAMAYGADQVLGQEAAAGKLAAQLGLGPREQARLGRIAGTLYANAYGESFGDVTDAVGAVRSSLDGLDSNKQLRRTTADALNLAAVFEYDVARSAAVAGQLVSTGLAKNASEAFDLITKGSQRVRAANREDLLDAADEYGQFFANIGLNGREAFQLLVQGAEDGMYGIDKTADAIKEFSNLSTDMSTGTRAAYKLIGLDARQMADDVLSGGDRASDAMQRIVDGLLEVESPSRRAQAALALFGTPLEDLSVQEIPQFLRSLKLTRGGMDDVRGAAREMGKAVGDNAQTDFIKMKRGLERDVVGFMAQDVLPFLKEDFTPAIKDMWDVLDDVPSWAVKGSVGGFLGLVAAGKLGSLVGDLRSLRGGLGGTVASKAAPVPVFVTNQVPGAGGGPAGVAAGGGGLLGSLLVGGGTLLGAEGARRYLQRDGGALDNPASRAAFQAAGGPITDYLAFNMDDIKGPAKVFESSFGDMLATAREGVQDVMKAYKVLPKELITELNVDGVPDSIRAARDLVKQYDLTPAEKRTLFSLLGYDTVIRQASYINSRLDWAARSREARITVTTAYANQGYETRGGLQEGGGTTTTQTGKSGRRGRAIGPTSGRTTSRSAGGQTVVLQMPGMGELVGRVAQGALDAHDQWQEDLG